MKLSLILQAVDRWSKPTDSAAKSTGGLSKAIDHSSAAAEKARGRVRRFFNDMDYAERVSGRWGRSLRRIAESDFARLRRGIDATRAKVRGLAGDMALWGAGAVGSTIKWGAVGVAAGAGAGVGKFLHDMIGNAAKFEQYQVALEGTEGSAQKAKAAMAWVQKFAKDTPYDIDTVTDSFVRARGVGIDPMTGSFRILGDAAGGTRKSLMDAVEAIADAQTGEFERLKEFNITSSSKGKNVTFSYVTKAGKNASKTVKKDMASIRKAVLDVFDLKYGGGMARQAKTLTGIWNNLQDVVTNFELSVAGKGIFDRVKSRLQSVLDWTDKLAKDGRLDAWAQTTSNYLTELFDKADRFVHEVDWKSVVDGVGGITGAVITLVEWLGKATKLWNEFNAIGSSIDKRFGFDNGKNSLESKAWGLLSWDPFDAWRSGKPAEQPQARRRGNHVEWPVRPGAAERPERRWPQSRQGQADTWRRALQAKPVPAAPAKLSLDINLKGDGAKSARVAGMDAPRGTTLTVNRGTAMEGAA
ncbi:tape measure protein [Sphingomonas sp. TX0522]|uniref:tape measure protein n=1 Tax=Sphingomonas sp. TX0522 TaxID=2479205 RepID=UPI0018DFB94A|nr:tape measure protein [Sphingomonas sp. TX0522]